MGLFGSGKVRALGFQNSFVGLGCTDSTLVSYGHVEAVNISC